MIFDYDEEADAAFLYFGRKPKPGEEARSEPADVDVKNASIIFLYDTNDRLLGFEFLGASKLFDSAVLRALQR